MKQHLFVEHAIILRGDLLTFQIKPGVERAILIAKNLLDGRERRADTKLRTD